MEIREFKPVLNSFFPEKRVKKLSRISSGLINKSYRIDWEDSSSNFLQNINSSVFSNPSILDKNMSRFFDFMNGKWKGIGLYPMELIKNPMSDSLVFLDGEYWRMMNFIPETKTIDFPSNNKQISSWASSYATLLSLISEENPSNYEAPIIGFMDSNKRLADLKMAVSNDKQQRLASCQSLVDQSVDFFTDLEFNLLNDSFRYLSINDCKISNVLFDNKLNQVKAIVDFDTLMNGSYYFDFADIVRSGCSNVPEDGSISSEIEFNVQRFSIIANSFWRTLRVKGFTPQLDLIWLGLINLHWQQAARFLSDYLNGDIYYRTDYDKQNLVRAKNQLAILSKIIQLKSGLLLALRPILNR